MAEVVVGEHEICGLPGDLRTTVAHRDADVRAVQGRPVVHAVTGHRYDRARGPSTPGRSPASAQGWSGRRPAGRSGRGPRRRDLRPGDDGPHPVGVVGDQDADPQATAGAVAGWSPVMRTGEMPAAAALPRSWSAAAGLAGRSWRPGRATGAPARFAGQPAARYFCGRQRQDPEAVAGELGGPAQGGTPGGVAARPMLGVQRLDRAPWSRPGRAARRRRRPVAVVVIRWVALSNGTSPIRGQAASSASLVRPAFPAALSRASSVGSPRPDHASPADSGGERCGVVAEHGRRAAVPDVRCALEVERCPVGDQFTVRRITVRRRRPPSASGVQSSSTSIRASVRVPVLSVAKTVTEPRVSTAGSRRIDGMAGRHAPCTQGQAERDHGGQRLRHRSDRQADRGDQHQLQRLAPGEAEDEHHRRQRDGHQGQRPAELGEAALQRGGLDAGVHEGGDPAQRARGAGRG